MATAQEKEKISAAPIIEKTLKELTIEAAFVKYREMRAQKESYSIPLVEFLNLGFKFLEQKKTQEAIAVLNMTVEAFPDSDQAYIGLGMAYRSLDLADKDIKCVTRAFDIRDARMLAGFLTKNKSTIAKNADEVIDRYIEAIGGKENLMKIKTIKITLTGLDSVNQEAAILRYYKFPYYYRQTVASSGISTVTDGNKVWRVTAKEWQETPRSNFKYAPDIYGDFIDYKKKGISYKLMGIEALDSQVMYRLLKTYKDGQSREYYFSAETGLFVMERRDFGIGKDIKRHYDWREVDGILFPFLFVVTNKIGLGNSHGGIIKVIKINESLDDSLFIKQ
jgi:tetratricopeptide (TPR) repeat protein